MKRTQKTITFTKKPLKITNDLIMDAVNIIKVGGSANGLRFTMMDYQEINGHDDSLPYNATLYLNGKPFCKCMNDGWGGDTLLTPIVSRNEFEEVKSRLKGYKSVYLWQDLKFVDNVTINSIANHLACTCDVYGVEYGCRKK
jgi:hypothetical protein